MMINVTQSALSRNRARLEAHGCWARPPTATLETDRNAELGETLPGRALARYRGNANTYSAWPRFGGRISGVIVAGTPRGLPPPKPVATAMYCLPSTAKLIGKPCTEVASRVSTDDAAVAHVDAP